MRCRAGTSGFRKEVPGLRSNIACCGAHGTTAGCAHSPTDGEKDGGLGGTGNASEPCEEQLIME